MAPPPGDVLPAGCLAGDSDLGNLVVERDAFELEKKDFDVFVLGEGGRGTTVVGDCGG